MVQGAYSFIQYKEVLHLRISMYMKPVPRGEKEVNLTSKAQYLD